MKKGIMWAMACMVIVVFGLVACGGGGDSDGGDTSPAANAGSDQNVLVGWEVTLDGGGSRNASEYSWTLTKPGTSTAALSDPTVSGPMFTADVAGTYTLSLAVGNGTATSSPDTVTITAFDPRPVPDTGQTVDYTPTPGEDGDYSINPPSYSYHLPVDDGTITDNVTGLMWQKCSQGQLTTSCTGTPVTYNWYEASGTTDPTNPDGTDVCGDLTLGGHSDWRLPTAFELLTISDYSGNFPETINTGYFSPSPIYADHWSSTADLFGYAWDFSFLVGDMSMGSMSAKNYVRCVRGESPPAILTDNGDGTVTDDITGLIWQKQADGTKRTWEEALTYCQDLPLPGSGWRLPNVKELASILDVPNHGPTLNNTDYFSEELAYAASSTGVAPAPTDTDYWSSTTDTSNTTRAYSVNFYYGQVESYDTFKTDTLYTRCVR